MAAQFGLEFDVFAVGEGYFFYVELVELRFVAEELLHEPGFAHF